MGDVLCVSAVRPGCCSCCSERRGSQHIQGLQHVETTSTVELMDITRATLPVPSLQPQHFHTLQTQICRLWRPGGYADPFQEENVAARFKWQRQGITFGAATSYVPLEKLREGSSATVYKGISRTNGQLVALKVIRLEAEEGVPFTANREASLLKRLKHANIVLLHDIFQTKETLTFVLEYMHTDLTQYMAQHLGGLHPWNVMLFMFQLLRSLAYIHQQHILHHDLKPQNLLISCLGELKLADFGLARAKSIPSQTYSSKVVTIWYRPPEVLLGATDYYSDLDIWSAGCIFVEMIQGQPVFAGTSGTPEQLEKIWEVLGVPTEDTWPGLSKLPSYKPELVASRRPQRLRVICDRLSRVPAAEDLASGMLTAFPLWQISAQNALLHGFFSPLPPQLYQVPSGQSVLAVPAVRLQPEICDLSAPYQQGHLSEGSSKFW
ncbi:LOW QUALITY PROTEIN: cyclin-dependent kinase 15 [Cygnus olor]|uniref:LOW QUALITY PROTEIN: cyclin-dependent kinase 15 n=1 Tax=Cygnus olor TaxID=8869 RepID=UPI001ADE8785|nr:LOW QUALITY PROTEIN: cyclin-dependent kinase 15 [Cygnus olor]